MPYRIGGVAERANVAGRLTSLVNDISRSRRGRPIRWLEDGGMFHLKKLAPSNDRIGAALAA
jgi:hypothetical protein